MTRTQQMIEYCDKENIYWFDDLAYYCMDKRKDWFSTLSTNRGGSILGIYLASKAHRAGLLTDEQYNEWVEDCIYED